jgi:glycosyltransferase involved in cell wall biosynthesis
MNKYAVLATGHKGQQIAMTKPDSTQIRPRVALLSPPIDRSGGIGTLYTYALPYLQEQVECTVLDTRGYGHSPWSSVKPLMRSLGRVTLMRLRREVDLVHVNFGAKGSAVRKLIAIFFCSVILRIPCVAQLHSSSFDTFYYSLPAWGKLLIRRNLRHCKAILVLGRRWQELLLELTGFEESRVNILPMGVPNLAISTDDRGAPRGETEASTHKTSQDLRYALFAGEMGERKGLPYIIEALAYPEAAHMRAVIAGAGDLTPWIRQAEELGVLEKCVFVGLVTPGLIHELMRACDCLVLPSRAEGLPVSVLEGLSAERLVIATPAGALGEYVVDGHDVFLLESSAPKAIAAAFARLADEELLTRVVEQGRKTWENQFDVRITSENLVNLWRRNIKV